MDNPIPIAPKRPERITTHGDTRIDPWFWLRDVDDPETLEYLRAENAYTEAVMAPEEALQERLTTRCGAGSKRTIQRSLRKKGTITITLGSKKDSSTRSTVVNT